MARIQLHNVISKAPVYVGCSAGVDSIAVSHFLRGKRDVKLFYFNHNLRPQNHKMQEKVEEFGKDHNIEVIVSHAFGDYDVETVGKEAAYRQKRLAAMKRLKGQIVLAHHLDDCVESYLANCFKGQEAYLPIPIRTELNDDVEIVRPFLTTRKSDFFEYCEKFDLLRYVVEDETNGDQGYRRNWLRHRVVPVIEEQYPGLSKVVKKRILNAYKNWGCGP